jgi:hypothetical protein
MISSRNTAAGEAAMRNGKPARDSLGIITALAFVGYAVLQSSCSLLPYRQGGQPDTKASAHKGAEVVVTLIESSQRGELVSVEADGLVITTESGITNNPGSRSSTVTLACSDIKSVRVIKNKHIASGALVGAIVGIPLGVVAAKVSGVEADDWGDAIGKGSLFLGGGMLFGAAAGILLATAFSKGEVYVLEHKSNEEIEKILIQLNKRARVKDHQQRILNK